MWARWSLLATVTVASLLVASTGLAADPLAPMTPEEARARAPSPRIFGGTEVDPAGKYPFTVSLHGPGHFCGGSLIDADWVLTAAHCVTDTNGNPNWFPSDEVVIGRHDLTTGAGEAINFQSVVVHPLWDGEGFSSGSATRAFDYDVALIRLATPATAGGPVTLATGADAADWAPGQPGTVMGWGLTEANTLSDVLLEVDVPFVSDPGCDAEWGSFFVDGLIICAGGVPGEDSCGGDSGGPLIAPPGETGWKQVALVSGGAACGSNIPAFHAFLPNLRSFVEATVATNSAPAVTGDPIPTEEDTPVVIDVAADLLANDSDDHDFELLPIHVTVDDSGLTDGTLTDNGDGTFTYDPDPGFVGTDTFTYTVADSAPATSVPATVTVTVTAVNEPPVANDDGGAGFTTVEDTAFTTADVTTNDTDAEDGIPTGPVNVVSPPSDGSLTDNGNGTFGYDPDPDFNGTDTFTYTVDDSGGATSNEATVTITVTAVNDPPTADPQLVTVAEDGFVAITLTGSDPDGDPLAFSVTSGPTEGDLTGTPPSVTYAPFADSFTDDSFEFEVDDGNGGTDTATITIDVLSVNDPPVVNLLDNEDLFEDAPAQTVPGFMNPAPPPIGPPNEAGQGQNLIAFTVTNDFSSLFAVQPAIDRNTGTLTYTPAADANGVATVTVTATDDGPPENGGDDTTVETFTITIDAVNDPPSFTAGPNQTAAEDAGPQTVPGWATGISAGPAEEAASQAVTFSISSNSNPGLFTAAPAVAPNGTLTFTSKPNAHGTATVGVRAKDNGGTPNGGIDTSASQLFTITVTPVNDAPVAAPDAATVGDGDTVDAPVVANDTDIDGDPLTPVVVSQPSRGTATVVGASVRYAHDGSGAGSDSFTYRASDGTATSNIVTVSVTITDDGDGVDASVENGAPNGGDGNGDGVPDRRQGGVTSLPNAVDGSYVTLVSSGAARLGDVTAFDQPASTPPPLVEFPVGFFSFDVAPVPPGGLAIVDMILHGDPEIDTFYKFGPTQASPSTSTYNEFRFEDAKGAELLPGMVRLHLVDGQDGDADLAANGTVVDPGAPARTLPGPPPPPPPTDELVGLVDPATGRWHLRRADATVVDFLYGNPGDVPFMGDWDCDGVDTPGLFRTSDAFVYLRNSNSQGIADIRFFFGDPADVPIAGDFDGDGCDTVSLYRPSEQRFYIINKLGSGDQGVGAADTFFTFGDAGDQPVAGDWDGDGVTEVGLHRETTGLFYWRNTLRTGIADGTIIFGNPGDRFVAGDWGTVDGRDTPAVFRPATTTFFFRHTLTQGNADDQFPFGAAGWLPVAGAFFD